MSQLQQLSAALVAALPQHPDGPVVQSLPRSGGVNAAQILAELGDDRTWFATDVHLAAEARGGRGAAIIPVAWASPSFPPRRALRLETQLIW